MIFDQIEGYFAGFGAGAGRILLPVLAIELGAITCACTDWYTLTNTNLFLWLLAFPFLVAGWLAQGFWAVIGLTAFGFLLVAACSFALENDQRRNFYVIYAASTVYYSLGHFENSGWIYLALVFTVCTSAYWFLPAWLDRFRELED